MSLLCTDFDTFWCCTGSALEDFAKLNDTIYFHDEEGIYVNLASKCANRNRQPAPVPSRFRSVFRLGT